MPQPVLTTPRLVMRPLADEHLDLEIGLHLDAEVMRYVGGPARSAPDVEEAHARRMALGNAVDGLGYWIASIRGEEVSGPSAGDFVGLMMLPPAHGPDQPDDPGVADLGYRLARAAWGRGYAREAVGRLLDHAFATVGLERVIAQTRSDNLRSRHLLEVVGLQLVRSFRSLDHPDEGPLDVEYEMHCSDWTGTPAGND